MSRIFSAIVVVILLNACSSTPSYNSAITPPEEVANSRAELQNSSEVMQVLNQLHADWRHVKYRMGGLSKSGIDCSGLVYKTYRTKFGINLPRSTEYQSKAGQAIRMAQLKAGDLVFFKTGISRRHVGIYMEKGNFLHVSSSRGVKISNLKNPYWRSRYWTSRRL